MREGAYFMIGHPLRLCVVALVLFLGVSLQACSGSQPNNSASPSAPPAYEGYLDVVNCDAIIAWGWDSNRPNDPVKLDIYDGNLLLATVVAEHFRQDLLNAGKGNGKHYVIWNVPVQLKDGKPHVITVKYGGTALEVAPPKEITCNFEK